MNLVLLPVGVRTEWFYEPLERTHKEVKEMGKLVPGSEIDVRVDQVMFGSTTVQECKPNGAVFIKHGDFRIRPPRPYSNNAFIAYDLVSWFMDVHQNERDPRITPALLVNLFTLFDQAGLKVWYEKDDPNEHEGVAFYISLAVLHVMGALSDDEEVQFRRLLERAGEVAAERVEAELKSVRRAERLAEILAGKVQEPTTGDWELLRGHVLALATPATN